MKIICQNHHNFHSIKEILRLFFNNISQKDGKILYVQDNLEKDYSFYSQLSQKISIEQIRDQSDQTNITVKSFIKDTDLSFESNVVPSVVRREIKRQTYSLLSQLLKVKYPWGSLTGIRPTHIIFQNFLQLDKNLEKTKEKLINHWFLSPEKAQIGLETAIREEKILDSCHPDLAMLYIGIPFCSTRCSYCSFITRDATKQKSKLDEYVTALIREIKQISASFKSSGKTFQAVYLGGGTPTALPDQSFYKLMKTIKEEIPMVDQCELTIEAGRPDSISKNKLEAISLLENPRICINPQTMHDRTLKLIGRDHSVEQVYQAFSRAREYDFTSINMDLILGLPGERSFDFLESLDKVLKLDPESITIHTLALKRSAFLEEKFNQKYLDLRYPDSDLSQAFTEAIRILKENNFQPYYMYRQKNTRAGLENIGFTKAGHACKYNVGMMSDQISIIGLGSGSTTKLVDGNKVDRLYNPKDLLNYSQRIDELMQKKMKFFNNIR